MTSVRRRGVALAALLGCLVFVGSALLPNAGLLDREKDGDTALYHRYADAILDGGVPYRDFLVVYPPGALPVFAATEPGDDDGYTTRFKVLMALLGAALVVVVVATLRALGTPGAWLAGVAVYVGLLPAALGMPAIANFDLWPALLTAGALGTLVLGRHVLGFSLLGAAATAKVFPAALLPLAFLLVRRRAGPRAAWRGTGAFLAVVVLVMLPFALLSPGGLRYSFEIAAERGLQLESLASSVLMAASRLGIYDAAIDHYLDSQNLAGTGTGRLAAASTLLQLAAVVLVLLLVRHTELGTESFLLASAATVAGVVAFGKVLSPQYLVWLVPVLALVASRRTLAALALLAAVVVLTQVWFPARFDELLALGDVVWLVLVRNVLIVALFAVLLVNLRSARSPPELQTRP